MARQKTTINDIATAAGVSKTTVSRYINGHYDLLSESARTRIEKAIELAHYTPNPVARSLKSRQSFMVGVIVANLSTPFATSLLNGISHGLRDEGYMPMFADATDSPTAEDRLIEMLVSHQVDGLIVNTTTACNRKLVELANDDFPIVLADRYIRDHSFDIAVCDYTEPTIELVECLAGQGYPRVVMFTEPYEDVFPRVTRLNAFLECDEQLFGAADPMADVYVVNPWDDADVEAKVRACLADSAGAPCAIYATNTLTLIATYNAVRKLGVTMPEPLGLCGPDDWGWAHAMGWDWPECLGVGITTFETNPFTMGVEAAKLMVRRIKDPEVARKTQVIPTRMMLRASTALKRG